jgi:hypothetical protein
MATPGTYSDYKPMAGGMHRVKSWSEAIKQQAAADSDFRFMMAAITTRPKPITAEELDSLNANQLAYMIDRGDE